RRTAARHGVQVMTAVKMAGLVAGALLAAALAVAAVLVAGSNGPGPQPGSKRTFALFSGR
ncbi:MAG TPA: hypothetical protein VFA45_03050, partial [Actinomycetes bacterium]|nr:hypothetical protein [Actinomycetes bacterium]